MPECPCKSPGCRAYSIMTKNQLVRSAERTDMIHLCVLSGVSMNKKTLAIICSLLLGLLLAILLGLHLLGHTLDPFIRDMTKIFVAGALCGLAAGIWLGMKLERAIRKDANRV